MKRIKILFYPICFFSRHKLEGHLTKYGKWNVACRRCGKDYR